jgi:hypothetical protein
MWVVLPEAEIAFIGDMVTVAEPPYLGDAQLEDWLNQLEELRGSAFRSFLLIAGRDGVIEREDLNDMADSCGESSTASIALAPGAAPPKRPPGSPASSCAG